MTKGESKTSVPVRCVHLLRHGQYAPEPGRGDGPLTPLGRRQAKTAGRYLKRWPIRQLSASDLERASETATIVAREMGVSRWEQSALLREVVPSAIPGARVPLEKRRASREAVERVLARYFGSSASTRHDLLVCHGNLIRALVCAVIGAPATAWLRLATRHCALTSIAVLPDGERRLIRYGEGAYLSDSLLTG
ncbi:MAG: histidine phosphatase family protein [Myxococcales bacterium]|nr:histidine phosphatase family protein [Myxococcales bacterium]